MFISGTTNSFLGTQISDSSLCILGHALKSATQELVLEIGHLRANAKAGTMPWRVYESGQFSTPCVAPYTVLIFNS